MQGPTFVAPPENGSPPGRDKRNRIERSEASIERPEGQESEDKYQKRRLLRTNHTEKTLQVMKTVRLRLGV